MPLLSGARKEGADLINFSGVGGEVILVEFYVRLNGYPLRAEP